jgi:tryptophan synthase alpha chain
VITPDLIPDEAAPWLAASDRTGLDRVFLVAPSSTEARLAATVAACRGFVYAASTMGVTGTRATVSSTAGELVARTRAVAGDLAVCVGLGVSNGDQAAEVAAFADGVIVGSAYVKLLLEGRGPDGVRVLSQDLAKGVRA